MVAYIRLKRRRGKKENSIYAVLVESERVDGKPRQRVIRHLAAIQEGNREYPGYRFSFWERIENNLTELGYTADEVDHLAAKATETVPRPSRPEMEKWKQEREEWRQKMRAMFQYVVPKKSRRRETLGTTGEGANHDHD